MPLPLIPLAIAALAGTSLWVSKKRGKDYGVMTPQRQVVYDAALKTIDDPNQMRSLAKAFREQGLAPQADILEKRAKLKELPVDVKAARREVFHKAMASQNPDAVEAVAASFEGEAAHGVAHKLRTYARGLRLAKDKSNGA